MVSQHTQTFGAPWGWSLILVSVAATCACVAAGVIAAVDLVSTGHAGLAAIVCLLPTSVWAGCGLFAIRGYTFIPGLLLVHRLFWETRVSLAGLQSVTFEPNVMRWSLRAWGNGGLFAFSGWYWRRRLGWFRAFVTDLNKTVVLRSPGQTIVISPDLPEQFVYQAWASPGELRH